MRESKDKIIVTRTYEDTEEYLARKKKEDAERKKQESAERRKKTNQEKRNARLAQSAPYPTNLSSNPQPKKLSNDQILALETKSQPNPLSNDQILALKTLEDLDNKIEISDVKRLLDVTPSKPVPDGSEIISNVFQYTPMELERSERREEFKRSQPNELKFDEIDMGFDLNEEIEERGGRKRRKSRKLRKSPKKSRKSKRKTTRKVRRHRRR